jgi:hypothetical protein
MSSKAPCDRPDASPFDRRGTGAYNINAGIDSSIHTDPAHRGTLSTPELELIHQSASYKQAMYYEKEDKFQQTRQIEERNKHSVS